MTYPPTRNSGPNPPVNQTLPYGPPPPIEKHRLNKKFCQQAIQTGLSTLKITPNLSYLKRELRYGLNNKPLTKQTQRPQPVLTVVTNQPLCCAKECTIDTSDISTLFTPASPFWLLSKLQHAYCCATSKYSALISQLTDESP